jgi:branched-chain amino acid transport system substrate-binding protein
VADRVAVVIGHQCSGAAIAASPVYEAAGVILISPYATNPQLTERGLQLVFRVIGRDDQQAAIAAAYIADHFAGRTIAVLHDTRSYGLGLAEEVRRQLQSRGMAVAIFEPLSPEALEYSGLVQRMLSQGIEVLYYGGYQREGGLIRRQSWEAGLTVPMLTGDGITADDYWLIAGPDAAAATLSSNAPDPRGRPEAAPLIATLQTAGYRVTPRVLHAYAAVQVWAQAVKAARSTDQHAVARILRDGWFDTVIGQIGFDIKGDLVGPATFVWYTWRNGTYVPLQEAAASVGDIGLSRP